jgi:hypothetical protein
MVRVQQLHFEVWLTRPSWLSFSLQNFQPASPVT